MVSPELRAAKGRTTAPSPPRTPFCRCNTAAKTAYRNMLSPAQNHKKALEPNHVA